MGVAFENLTGCGDMLGSINKKLVMLSRFRSLRGLGGEGEVGLTESVKKKGKFVKKIFFSDNVE